MQDISKTHFQAVEQFSRVNWMQQIPAAGTRDNHPILFASQRLSGINSEDRIRITLETSMIDRKDSEYPLQRVDSSI